MLPRFLSNASDAPYIGECALLFNIAQPTAEEFKITEATNVPGIVYWFLPLYLVIPFVLVTSSFRQSIRWHRHRDDAKPRVIRLQAVVWIFVLVVGIIFLSQGMIFHGLIFILLCQLFPFGVKYVKGTNETEKPTIESA